MGQPGTMTQCLALTLGNKVFISIQENFHKQDYRKGSVVFLKLETASKTNTGAVSSWVLFLKRSQFSNLCDFVVQSPTVTDLVFERDSM